MPAPVFVRFELPPRASDPANRSDPPVTLAVSVFPAASATIPPSVSLLVAVCSSVPDSFTATLLLKVVPVPLSEPNRSLAATPSMRIAWMSVSTALVVPPPPKIDIVPSTTRSVAPSRSLARLSRISSPVPRFFTSSRLAKPPSATAPIRKSALPATTKLFPFPAPKPVAFAASTRVAPTALLTVSVVVTPGFALKMTFFSSVPAAPSSVTTVLASRSASSSPGSTPSVSNCVPDHVTPCAIPASSREAMEEASMARAAARTVGAVANFMICFVGEPQTGSCKKRRYYSASRSLPPRTSNY